MLLNGISPFRTGDPFCIITGYVYTYPAVLTVTDTLLQCITCPCKFEIDLFLVLIFPLNGIMLRCFCSCWQHLCPRIVPATSPQLVKHDVATQTILQPMQLSDAQTVSIDVLPVPALPPRRVVPMDLEIVVNHDFATEDEEYEHI